MINTRAVRFAIIDDDSFWRESVPDWLGHYGYEFETFSNYRNFEDSLKMGISYSVVLGDYIISSRRSKNGLLWLEELVNSYGKSMGTVYLYTVKKHYEILKETGGKFPANIEYLSKEVYIETIFENINP